MLLRLLLFYIKTDLRNYFQSKIAILGLLFGIYLNLVIYWYTSKIFSASVDGVLADYGTSYFEYLLIGDLILQGVSSLLENNLRHMFMLKVNGMGKYLRTTAFGIERIFVLRSFSTLPRDFCLIFIYFILGKTFFELNLTLLELLLGILLQVLILPAFIGLSLFMLGTFSLFGRGSSIIGFINTGAAIIAGGYFPVEVLPGFMSKFSLYITPFNTLMYGYRKILVDGDVNYFLKVVFIICVWNIILFPAGYFLFKILQKLEFERDKKYIFEN